MKPNLVMLFLLFCTSTSTALAQEPAQWLDMEHAEPVAEGFWVPLRVPISEFERRACDAIENEVHWADIRRCRVTRTTGPNADGQYLNRIELKLRVGSLGRTEVTLETTMNLRPDGAHAVVDFRAERRFRIFGRRVRINIRVALVPIPMRAGTRIQEVQGLPVSDGTIPFRVLVVPS